MTPFPDVIEELINNLNYQVSIKEYIDNLDGTFTVSVSSTLHVRDNSIITIGTTDYRVVSVVNNTSITFESASQPIGTSFTAKKPFFIHGSLIAANTELSKVLDADEKLPMVYLFESFTERRYVDRKTPIQREVRARIYVLDSADFSNWLTDDHYQNAVVPMDNLARLIVDTIERSGEFGNVDDYDLMPMVRFGQITDAGNVKLLFSEYASGVLIDITIPIMKPIKC